MSFCSAVNFFFKNVNENIFEKQPLNNIFSYASEDTTKLKSEGKVFSGSDNTLKEAGLNLNQAENKKLTSLTWLVFLFSIIFEAGFFVFERTVFANFSACPKFFSSA